MGYDKYLRKKTSRLIILFFLSLFIQFFIILINKKAMLLIDNVLTGNIYIVILMLGLFLIAINFATKNTNISEKYYVFFDNFQFFIFFFLLLYSINITVLTPMEVNGYSMYDTFNDKDKVLVKHLFNEYNNGDIVIFENEHTYDEIYVKRVCFKPGDKIKISFENTILYGDVIYIKVSDLNDGYLKTKLLDEKKERIYLLDKIGENLLLKVDDDNYYTVPKNKYFVLGDNQDDSQDSKAFGLISESDILGKVVFRVFPKWGVVK